MRPGRVLTVVLGAVLTLVACTDSSSHSIGVVNELDKPVILWLQFDATRTVRVPARSWGGLASGWGHPGPAWTIVVFDDQCVELGAIPVTEWDGGVHVRPDGTVVAAENWLYPPAGLAPFGTLKRGSC